jgi:hypothetical protein
LRFAVLVLVANAGFACSDDTAREQSLVFARASSVANGLPDVPKGSATSCNVLVPPDQTSCCTSCGGQHTCQPNGCYNGYWCNSSRCRCTAPPSNCNLDGGAAGTGGTGGAGGQGGQGEAGQGGVGGAAGQGGSGGSGGASGSGGSGPIGPNGGAVDRLSFAVWGDSRPPQVNDTTGYPSAILSSIAQRANATDAEFALTSGDYMFANTASAVSGQVPLLLAAEQPFTKFIFRAMGNHECTGASASNCPNGTETPNVRAYLMDLVPFTQTPYYSFRVDTSLGMAKFVVIAANAWSSTQQSWLDATLSQATTYTFVVRHEALGNNQAPGAPPSDTIIAAHPLTLAFYGHTHEYSHIAANHVISGNGGAPLRISGAYYGFLHVTQRADGNIQVQEIRETDGSIADTWAVSPTGAAVQ